MRNNILLKSLSMLMVLVCTLSMLSLTAFAATPTLSKSSVKMVIGASATIKVSGTSKAVTWSSSNSKIASVSSKGKITAKSTGSCSIYAEIGSTKLTCKVTVLSGKITLSKTSLKLVAGGNKATIKCTVSAPKKEIGINHSDSAIVSCTIAEKNGVQYIVAKPRAKGKCYLEVFLKSDPTIKTKITFEVLESGTKVSSTNKSASASKSTTTQKTTTAAVDESTLELKAAAVADLVNEERANAGKKALTYDADLCEVASLRAKELVSKNSHTRPNGKDCFTAIDEAGVRYYAAGENIAGGFSTAAGVMNGWMNSPGHKSNILSSNYSKIGVGCYYANGTYYWVQVFTG